MLLDDGCDGVLKRKACGVEGMFCRLQSSDGRFLLTRDAVAAGATGLSVLLWQVER